MILHDIDFSFTNLKAADLSGSILDHANFHGADLSDTKAIGVSFKEANFCRTDLCRTNLSGSDLSNANLKGSQLAETDLSYCNLIGCEIYGSSAWDLNLAGSIQKDLILTYKDGPMITVDNIEVAQFIYLLLHNERIRTVIDTVGKKAVLILGRFTELRKQVLEVIKSELRKNSYIPMIFDFEKPESRDLSETISTLAHIARFIIVDITDPRSVPHELMLIVPHLPSVKVKPIIEEGHDEYALFDSIQRYPWVLPVTRYKNLIGLQSDFVNEILLPLESN